MTFGVTEQATIIDQLVRVSVGDQRPVRVWSKFKEYLWILFFSLLGGGVAYLEPRPVVFGVAVVGGLVGLVGGTMYLLTGGLWVPVVPPAVAGFVSAAAAVSVLSGRQRQELNLLTGALSSQMSPAVVRSLKGDLSQITSAGRLQPQRMKMITVLFTDIKGFSGTSESLEASLLMQWLNEYLRQMCDCVNANGGVVIQYIGDSIMGAFGVPFPRETDEQFRTDAVSAVRCGVAMREAVRLLNDDYRSKNLPEIQSRIGIFSGPVAAGMLGDSRKLQYSVIGDTVNTAARLESYDKDRMEPAIAVDGCRILIGGPTRELIGNEFQVREIGATILHGKKAKTAVFAVV